MKGVIENYMNNRKIDNQTSCPLNNEVKNKKTRYEPQSRETAYCFQFHDMVRVLYSLSLLHDKESFKKELNNLKSMINSYERIS